MNSLAALQQLVPELNELLERRYSLLRVIRNQGPIGRRFIATQVGSSERVTRGELDILRDQGLIQSSSLGVQLTPEGEKTFSMLQSVVREFYNLEYLEQKLAAVLGVKKMIIVPGDADSDPSGKRDLARAAVHYLRDVLKDGDVLAVSGGTTMAKVAESFKPHDGPYHFKTRDD